MEKKKFTIFYISASNTIGGAELSLLSMMGYLRNSGFRVVLAMPRSQDKYYLDLANEVTDSIYFVKCMNWTVSQGSGLRKFKNWFYQAYKSGGWHITPVIRLISIILHERVDLVHTNTSVCIDGALAAKFTRRPHVQHIREITGVKKEALFRLKFQGTDFFRILNSYLNSVILCNSRYTLSECKVDYPIKKLKVFYNTIQLPKILPEAYKGGIMQICVMANITSRRKNHILVLHVANNLKKRGHEAQFKFNIYGKLPPEDDIYFTELIEFLNESNLQTIVEFRGLSKTSEILSFNHMLFHPFSGESFGRIFIEAMSFGRPVIAVQGGGASELVVDGKEGFLVSKDNPEIIANAFLKVVNDPAQYLFFSQNCLLKANRFSDEKVFPELLKTYNFILNKP